TELDWTVVGLLHGDPTTARRNADDGDGLDGGQLDARRRRPNGWRGRQGERRRHPQARTDRRGSTEAARSDDFRPPTHGSAWVSLDSPSSCLDLVIRAGRCVDSVVISRRFCLGFLGPGGRESAAAARGGRRVRWPDEGHTPTTIIRL
ncbi:hypothetical protein Dimus_037524, partial [Dionaea muscipula]